MVKRSEAVHIFVPLLASASNWRCFTCPRFTALDRWDMLEVVKVPGVRYAGMPRTFIMKQKAINCHTVGHCASTSAIARRWTSVKCNSVEFLSRACHISFLKKRSKFRAKSTSMHFHALPHLRTCLGTPKIPDSFNLVDPSGRSSQQKLHVLALQSEAQTPMQGHLQHSQNFSNSSRLQVYQDSAL